MNRIPDGAIVNFFSNGPDGRFEIVALGEKIPQPAKTIRASAPKPINAPPRPDPDRMRVEAFERMCLEETLNPAKIFAARRVDHQGESRPVKASESTLDAAAIYAQRRSNHDV